MMHIKGILVSLCLFWLVGCGNEEESPSYSFENKDAQGLVNGTNWSFLSGGAEVSILNTDELSFTLSDIEISNPCDLVTFGERQVYFTVPSQIGVYLLVLDTDDFGSYVVTMWDQNGQESDVFNIAMRGAIEILSISDIEVKGRLDARDDDSNFVNGNFTVSFCN